MGISLLNKYCACEWPYWLYFLYWNILTGCIFCTGVSLLVVFCYGNILAE
jgi:hypothetical protein